MINFENLTKKNHRAKTLTEWLDRVQRPLRCQIKVVQGMKGTLLYLYPSKFFLSTSN